MNYIKETQWADIKIAIDKQTVTGIRNVSYKESYDAEVLHSAGSEPIAIQKGNKTYEGTITLLKNEFDALHKAAIEKGYRSIIDVPYISITIAYLPAAGRKLVNEELRFCTFIDVSKAMTQGTKYMEIELPFKFLYLDSSLQKDTNNL
jgi:hypothetical protein